MCTAIALRGEKSFYFGRNMDIHYRLDFETARIEKDSFFRFSCGKKTEVRYGVVGTAIVAEGYPLYADGMNEKGVCMAGLEFPKLAYYGETVHEGKWNVSPYEFIPWVLTQCASAKEAEELLANTVLIDRDFSDTVKLTPLHWMIADKEKSLAVEATVTGLCVYDCLTDVLTNAPEYHFHTVNLRQYAKLTPYQPSETEQTITNGGPFSFGFGAIGLPGDYSSSSRFVKAEFVTRNLRSLVDESQDGCSELLRALFSVAVPRGAVKTANGSDNFTVYTSCMDAKNGKYFRVPYAISEFFSTDGVLK